MSDGKHCPHCQKDIGIWSVFLAGLPSRIRCPHCKTPLAYRQSLVVMLALLVGFGPVALGSYRIAQSVGTARSWPWIFVAVLIASWMPIELAVTLYLRARRVLQTRQP